MNALPDASPSYADTCSSWRALQPLLPVDMRIDDADAPREEWLDVGRFRVHLDHHGPQDAPATLVVVHGGGGNGRLLAPYGRLAAAHGFAAVAPDLPGYGLTQGPKRTVVYDDWRDVLAAVVHDTARRTGRPVVVFGLSMGGMLAYDATVRTRIPSALVMTCMMDARSHDVRRQMVRWPWLATLTELTLRVPRLADHGVVKMAWVSKMDAIANDPRISRHIRRDRRAGGTWMPGRWIRTFLTAEPEVEPEAFDVCPAVLAHPADDRWTDVGISLPFFERLPAHLRTLVLLEDAGHFPVEQPGRDQLAAVLLDTLRGAARMPAGVRGGIG